ncbi:MAG: hypothetical protein R2799_02680 [Crocinitomicaceae bacterium]
MKYNNLVLLLSIGLTLFSCEKILTCSLTSHPSLLEKTLADGQVGLPYTGNIEFNFTDSLVISDLNIINGPPNLSLMYSQVYSNSSTHYLVFTGTPQTPGFYTFNIEYSSEVTINGVKCNKQITSPEYTITILP